VECKKVELTISIFDVNRKLFGEEKVESEKLKNDSSPNEIFAQICELFRRKKESKT
jgi:hypothetical protein